MPTRNQLAYLPLLLASSLLAGGCGIGSHAELEDGRKQIRALRAENGQLKDQVVALHSQNRDLSRRSVDDDRRVRVLEASNGRLEETVTAYQKDRDSLAAAFDRVKTQVQAANDGPMVTASRSDP